MKRSNVSEMSLERRTDGVGQHHSSILLSLPSTNRNLPALDIDILHSKREALQ